MDPRLQVGRKRCEPSASYNQSDQSDQSDVDPRDVRGSHKHRDVSIGDSTNQVPSEQSSDFSNGSGRTVLGPPLTHTCFESWEQFDAYFKEYQRNSYQVCNFRHRAAYLKVDRYLRFIHLAFSHSNQQYSFGPEQEDPVNKLECVADSAGVGELFSEANLYAYWRIQVARARKATTPGNKAHGLRGFGTYFASRVSIGHQLGPVGY